MWHVQRVVAAASPSSTAIAPQVFHSTDAGVPLTGGHLCATCHYQRLGCHHEHEKPSSLFFEELTNVIEMLVVYSCPVVVVGDFDLRAQDDNDPDNRRFVNLLSSFDM